MKMKYTFLVAFASVMLISNDAQGTPVDGTNAETTAPQPVYQPQDNYVPHATYPYSDVYPNSAPSYDGYLVPAGSMQYPTSGEYMTALMPTAQTALQVALRIFAKIGLFLVGGIALLVVGGLFTTAICSLTPICTITFNGFSNINKETMRAYVSPDSISAAAGFVQDAIGKYQRLQRTGNRS